MEGERGAQTVFQIGEFSKFTRVSVKMLRHYDQLGLLPPARIDPLTNYRYYSADQLPRLYRILALRDLRFSLEQISGLLDDPLPVEQLRGMLRLKQAELGRQLQEEQRRLTRIAARLAQLEREGSPGQGDVVLRAVSPQSMATLRQVIAAGDETQSLFEEAERHVARYHARAAEPPLAILHDPEFLEHDVDVEVAIPVRELIPGTDRILVRELPGWETMACLVHTGPYDTIDDASSALLTWVEASGFQIAGPTREVYLQFSAEGLDIDLPQAYLARQAEDFVTELQVPVAKS